MAAAELKDGRTGANQNRRRAFLIGGAVVALIIAGSLIGVFVAKNKSSSAPQVGGGASGTGTSDAGGSGTNNGTSGGNKPSPHQPTAKQFFGYWGQSAIGNGVGPTGTNTRPVTAQQNSLASYCDTGLYQFMNIAFLHDFGGGDGHWGLDLSNLGRYDVSAAGVVSTTLNGKPIDASGFAQVGADIQHCQSQGIKVILSIGGDMHSPYQYIPGDGAMYANILFNSFLQGTSSQRPFGNAVLDGIEFDIEKTGPAFTAEQILMLQTLKKLSPTSVYSAVPQCFLNGVGMDLNTGPVIQQHPELLDYVIVQYYNNPTCSYPFGFNFDIWKTLFNGPLVIGLAGDTTSAITGGFLNAGQLQAVVDGVMTDSQFYGISVYDVSSSNPTFSTYSQTIRDALDGKVVGSGYPPQGNFTTEHQWATRCGGTWNYANETCGLPAFDVKEQPVPSTNPRKRAIIIGVVVAVLIVAGTLIGVFATKKDSSASAASNSSAPAKATASAPVASATGATNATTPPVTGGGKKKLFGYWGQNAIGNGVGPTGVGTRVSNVAQNSLAYYCDLGYYQTMNLAFLSDFGGGDGHWALNFARSGGYQVSAAGVASGDLAAFLQIGQDILHCQANNIKVILSIGGDKNSSYHFANGDGALYANILFNSFLQGSSNTRPFGSAILDGIEFDIEKTGPAYTQEQIIMLQTLKKLSPTSLYSAVPQCYLNGGLGDLNTGPIIQSHPELLDYVIIQYYNNPTCSYPFGFNFAAWKALYKGPLVIGLAGDVSSAITGGFLNAGQLQAVVDGVMTDSQFYGISVYDVSSSNPAFSTYSQTLRDALDGKRVGSGYPPQGPATLDTQWAHRCGGTWSQANETCGLPACVNGGCADKNQMCFSYMSPC
ncbi:hypothetical protein HDU98_008573 [Podochytrium sp. JEL0797]|nr:hypothetical protein HDU98_008573 [Podochytrium sp. JEL0797]